VLTGWLNGVGRVRVAASVVGGLSVVAMVIAGCASVTDGTPQVDAGAAPEYRTSVSASVVASEASSAARESDRQATLTTKAVHTVCDDMSTSSADAIRQTNDYVGSLNQNSPDVSAKAGPAIDALNRSADMVSGGIGEELSPQLRDSLTAWVDSARGVANAIATNAGPDQFNAAVDRVNTSRNTALDMCDDAY
jgi:hypothetical protein